MKIITLGIVIISISLVLNQTVYAQAGNLTAIIDQTYNKKNVKIGDTIYEGYTFVKVRYESLNTIVLEGDLINKHGNTFNSVLWQVMDLLKNNYGFEQQQIITNGFGTVGNPTTVYIIMTK